MLPRLSKGWKVILDGAIPTLCKNFHIDLSQSLYKHKPAYMCSMYHNGTSNKRHTPHITGLPGIWCSVFTESPDVSDFFLPKIGQKCQIGNFWGYSGPNLATLWKSLSHFQFGGNLAFLGPKLTDFKVLPDLDVNFPQKSLILAFLADFWWFWIWNIWQCRGNGQNP